MSYRAFEQITVAGSAIGFTEATIVEGGGHRQVSHVLARCRTAELSYRVDGGTPTASVGILLAVGDVLKLDDVHEIRRFRAIRTGSSGQLDCAYSDEPMGAVFPMASISASITGGDASAANQTLEIAVLGATTDAAIETDTTGSINGKMRGLIKQILLVVSYTSRLLSSAFAAAGTAAAATTGFLTGGVYNLTKPTITDTYQAPIGLTTKAAVRVAIETSTGTAIDSIGGGTQYAEDAAHTSGDTGTMLLAVRQDAAGTLAGTTGDYAPLQLSAGGAAKVVACKADGTSVDPIVEPAHGAADDANGPAKVGSTARAAAPTAVDEGDRVNLWLDLQGRLHAILEAGTAAFGKLAANSGVDIGDVDVTSVVPGTGATNLGKAESATHTTADVGVMALGIRKDTTGALAADGEYCALAIESDGGARVNGSVPHGTADTGSPVKIGGKGSAAAAAAVDGDDRVNASFDLAGRMRTIPQPSTTEGLSSYTVVSDATDLLLIKNAAGQVYGWYLQNAHATNVIYFKLYNHVDAPDPSADSADCLVNIGLQPKTAANVALPFGIAFSAGIGISITTGQATTDETAVGAGDAVANIFYK
jgi:hypothetical protein